ncbi:hypothetical protein [Kitasatospora sp. NPDC050463]|uniref:hypothetical protein n=1 Tax=Kitasatospora sp. NPDC050463 TaxID=3155786 RepID=UPI0033F01C76
MGAANVTHGERHGWTTLHTSGDLDLPAVDAARERQLRLIRQGCRPLLFDLIGLRSSDAGVFADHRPRAVAIARRDSDPTPALTAPTPQQSG